MMRPTLPLAAMLCPLFILTASARAATWAELLVQAQAADELGAAISASAERATFEAGRMTAFLRDSGTPAGLARSMAARVKPAQRVTYRELFDQAVARIKKNEGAIDGGADATLRNLTAAQLFEEMTAQQVHNITDFTRLNRQLDAIDALAARLRDSKQWDAYVKSTSGGPTTMPSVEALAALPATTADPAWRKQRQELRNAIAARLSVANDQPTQANASSSASNSATPPVAAPGMSTPYDDPRFRPYYYGADDNFNWNEAYSNPYNFNGGGGTYKRYDTRVNNDNDPRLNADRDRRVNIDNDRRETIHVDPRKNF